MDVLTKRYCEACSVLIVSISTVKEPADERVGSPIFVSGGTRLAISWKKIPITVEQAEV